MNLMRRRVFLDLSLLGTFWLKEDFCSLSDEPAAAKLVTCKGIGMFANPSMDIWCQIVCPQGFCPPSHCECKTFWIYFFNPGWGKL